MKHTTKWLLAREIIILFCCALTVLIIWIFLWAINVNNINKSKNIQKQIYSINHQIDSISDQISIDSFEEIFEGNIPKSILEENKKDPLSLNLIPDIDMLAADFDPTMTDKIYNINLLNALLFEAGYKFDGNESVKISENSNFNMYIFREIKDNNIEESNLSITKPYLYKTYNFLLAKKYLDVSFYVFYMELAEKPYLPPFPNGLTENHNLREIKKKELVNTKARIYSRAESFKIVKEIFILILIVVFPIRFLILLLIWSIKTLRQKQS